jgi:hypothetical protein
VRGKPRRHPTPTGPKQARRTVASVRATSDDALDRVIAAVREAKSGAARAVDAAKGETRPSSGSGG